MKANFAKAKAFLSRIWHNQGVQDAFENGLISAAEAITLRILQRLGLAFAAGAIMGIVDAVIRVVWH